MIANWEEGSAEENDETTTARSATSKTRNNFLDLKGTLTFRAPGHF
jgi:hypothetical protein